MATAKKSMAPKRRGKKQYPLVSFELEGFEGEFTLPKLDALPMGVAAALNDSDLSKLLKFLNDNAPESAEAVEDLGGDEFGELMKKWSDASGVEAGK